MKLFTKLLSIFSIFCISFYLISSSIAFEEQKLETFSEKDGYKKVYIHLFEKSDEEIYKVLTKLAKENKINLIKNDILEKENSKFLFSVFLGNENIEIFDDKKFTFDKFFKIDQTEDDVYISSKKDDKAYGKINSFLNWNNIEVGTLKRLFLKQESLKGEYNLRYSSENDYDNFVENLAKEFKIEDKKKLTEKTYGITKNIESKAEILSKVFLISCTVLLVMASAFYSAKCLKKVGIMKLCGYSNTDIFLKVFGSVFVCSLATSFIIDCFLIIFFRNVYFDFFMKLILNQFIINILIFLAMVPSLFLFKNYKISDLINNRNPLQIINVVSFAVKNVIVIALISLSFGLPGRIIEIPKLIKELQNLEKISDFAFVNYKGNGNIENFMKKEIHKILKKFF